MFDRVRIFNYSGTSISEQYNNRILYYNIVLFKRF